MSIEQVADPTDPGIRNPGIVYVLSNPAMPDYVKVGKTSGNEPKDVLARMKELDSTGVPRAFKCEYAAVVAEYDKTEQVLLTAFGENRVRPGREFLEGIPPYRVIAILKHIALGEVTPDSGAVPEETKEKPLKLPAFRFSMAGIYPGASLDWADDQNRTCQVIGDGQVSYEGEAYSLSRLTARLKGWNVSYAQVGPYWLYEGQTLDELRTAYLSDIQEDDS